MGPRRWRITLRSSLRRFRYRYLRRRTCLDCGFLAFADGAEADQSVRRTVAAKGSAGWFQDEGAVNCFRHLWNWEDDAPINIIVYETSVPRTSCSGFHWHSPGRSPKEHMTLEDERRSFRRQLRLALLSFLGAILGAMLGAWIGTRGG